MTPMNKQLETEMKTEKIIDILRNLNSAAIDEVIAALEIELREREFEEQAKQDYEDLLANQYC